MSKKSQSESLNKQASKPEEMVKSTEPIESTETDQKTLEDEIAELKDQLLRAVAETENLRKRNVREKEEALKYASTSFARDMLGVSDNLRRALDTIRDEDKARLNDNLKAMIEGIEMTEKELLNAFKRHGIEKISPQKGERFSHEYHQAMFEVETEEHESGAIMQLMQPGYTIHERLLRPAMVGVSKKPIIKGD